MSCLDPFSLHEAWANIGIQHHHGIIFALSSLHSQYSCGIGEILDLVPIIKWLSTTGFSIIQLLPLNDTGNDSSPYMGLSAYAMHPIYLSLHCLPKIDAIHHYQESKKIFDQVRTQERLNYPLILDTKLAILHAYFLSEEGQKISDSHEFHSFQKEHKEWLYPYAYFKALKAENKGSAWWQFEQYAKRPEDICHIDLASSNIHQQAQFWMMVQYLLFDQWQHIRTIAKEYNIKIAGDLPILVNKDSSDVWWNPHLFSLTASVGAPPDMYSPEGQTWGFPLYQWEEHEKEKYSWFQRRLQVQQILYDIYRIDHIVGLFRLWAVPLGKKATLGEYVPLEKTKWLTLGQKHIRILAEATSMLPIGEDLGNIPPEVRAAMREVGIPSMKVLRWEKDWNKECEERNRPFLHPLSFLPESVSMISTHDSSTLAGWWSEEPLQAKHFCSTMNIPWDNVLTPQLRFHVLHCCHASGSLFHMNLLQEYLGLIPDLSWANPQFDRVNTPATVSQMNWTWKTRTPLEEILNNKQLLFYMQQLSMKLAI